MGLIYKVGVANEGGCKMKDEDYCCPSYQGTCVLKNNGIFEKFSHEKIVKSCLMVGAPLWAAEKIASQAATAAYDGINHRDQELVYDSLKRVDRRWLISIWPQRFKG